MKSFFMVCATAVLTIGAVMPVQAQVQLSLVEGAACAQSSAMIERLERYNNAVHDEISDKQSASDRQTQSMANALILHFERMVEFRQSLIAEYELLCARGSMSYADMRKVCSPQSSGISFADTVFCKPMKETAQ